MTVRKDRKVSVEKVLDDSSNTGDPMAQVSIFTDRINYLTEHLKTNKKIIVLEEVWSCWLKKERKC